MPKRNKRARRLIPFLAAIALFLPAPVFADHHIAIVIEQGDQAPGLPTGITLTPDGLPVINAQGSVAFSASLAGQGITSANNEAIYVGTPGSLQLLARKGDPAPGTEAGTVFSDLTLGNGLLITKTGEVAFKARLSGPAVTAAKNTNNTGFWVGNTPANLRLIAREGDPAPDAPGAVFSEGSGSGLPPTPPYTDGGFTMKAQLSGNLGGLGNFGIWAGPPNELEQALRLGAPAPAVSSATVFGLESPVVNHSGEIAVPAEVSFSGGRDKLVYIGRPGQLEVFVRDGAVLPDLQPNESLNAPTSVNINDSGQLAFKAVIRPPQGSLTSVWAGGRGDLSLVARQGEDVPGAESGVTFGAISDTGVFINPDGHIVFQAALDGSARNEEGLFTGTAGNLAVLARTDLGVQGAGGPPVPGFHAYAINSESQVAFFTGGSNVSALWMGAARKRSTDRGAWNSCRWRSERSPEYY
jgi:hypothetical protein